MPLKLDDHLDKAKPGIVARCSAAFTTVLSAILITAILTIAPPAAANPKYAGLVMDATSGEILYASNIDKRLYPASLTKMMTLYLTFRAISDGRLALNSSIKVSRNAADEPASKLGLRSGERIKVEEAIYALVVKSANDVATAMGERLGGSEKGFASLANETARRLDMQNTVFHNAHGLPNRSQVSTARDMAKLSQALIRDFPQFYHYFGTTRWTFRGTTYRSHNKLLGNFAGMDGLKTGYIRAAGYNLAASAKRGELRLIGIVFGGRTSARRNNHMAKILDRAFDSDRGQFLIANGSVPNIPIPVHRPSREILVAGGIPAPAVAGFGGPNLLSQKAEPEAAPSTITLLGAGRAPGRPDRAIYSSEGPLPQEVIGLPLPERRPGDETAQIVDLAPTGAVDQTQVAFANPASIRDILEQIEFQSSKIGPDDGSTWSVQLGAYAKPGDAERILSIAQSRVGDLTQATRMLVPNDNANDDPLFRARLTDMDESEATKACALLATVQLDCIIIPPSSVSG